jgi:hypothetical protein
VRVVLDVARSTQRNDVVGLHNAIIWVVLASDDVRGFQPSVGSLADATARFGIDLHARPRPVSTLHAFSVVTISSMARIPTIASTLTAAHLPGHYSS